MKIKDFTWVRGEFLFECSSRYIELNTRREILCLQAAMYKFLFINISATNYEVLSNCQKIFTNSPKTVRRLYEHVR